MFISNELLAAYAEGNVSEAERKIVRQYLTDHQEEIETVMMMMDEDYDLDLDDVSDSENKPQTNSNASSFDICYSAAAFAPPTSAEKSMYNNSPTINKTNFDQRLNNLLDEIIE